MRRILTLLAALAILLFGAPVTHAAAADATPGQIERAVFHEINRERAAHGLRPLWRCSMLNTSAHRHDLRMAAANTLSHQLPGEPDIGQRELNAGYNWTWAGENIGWNSDMSLPGAVNLELAMYREKPPDDGHRLNILSTHFRAVGVDVVLDQTHHKLWLTTDFGRR